MRKLKTFFVICISSLSLGSSCDTDYSPPDVEHCIIISQEIPGDINEWPSEDLIYLLHKNTCVCIDKNLPSDEQEYERPLYYCRKYLAVSPINYGILQDHFDDIVNDLIDCESD